MLPRQARLSHKEDVARVLKGGLLKRDDFSLRFARNNFKETRFAFVVPKSAVKKATGRNLIRRRARETIRKELQNMKKGYDVVFIFYKKAETLPFSDLEKSMLNSLRWAKILL